VVCDLKYCFNYVFEKDTPTDCYSKRRRPFEDAFLLIRAFLRHAS
jgi:hypothetical protein